MVTDDGRYLLIVVETTAFGKNLLFYQDLREPAPKTVELIRDLEALYVAARQPGERLLLPDDRPRAQGPHRRDRPGAPAARELARDRAAAARSRSTPRA